MFTQCHAHARQPAHYNMGMLEFEAQRHAQALVHYERAAALHPLYAEPHCNMGVVFKLQGDNQCALPAPRSSLSRAVLTASCV